MIMTIHVAVDQSLFIVRQKHRLCNCQINMVAMCIMLYIQYWLLPEQSRVDTYRATRLERDFDDSHENLYLCLNMCVTINYQIHDILATRMGCSGL